MTVHYERIPSTDSRLARHVRHDEASKRYPFDTSGLSIVSAKHTRRVPVFDQGQLGSCTGNAGMGCILTDPFFDAVVAHPWKAYTFDENGAVNLYSDATKLDDYPGGYYAPDWQDTGSDGLSIAKALKNAGEISGYQHTFNLDDALKALGVTPYITGTNWYSNAMDTDQNGRVYPTGKIVGGHEWVVDEIDVEFERVWGTQSWGNWGVVRDGRPGRFYYTFNDYGDLLSQQGDVTIFTPLTQPAPTPTPVPTPGDPDAALAAVAHPWVRHLHTSIAGNSKMRAALKSWLAEKGL